MQDLDTMTNLILNNEYKLHEEEQKTNFESGNNGNNNQIKHGEVFIFQYLIDDVLDNPGNVKIGCRYSHHTDDGYNQQFDIGLQKMEKPFITV